MNVQQVVPGFSDEAAGPSYSVSGLCRGLAANGVDVTLHALTVPAGAAFPFKVFGYPRSSLPCYRLGHSPKMKRGLRKACEEADIIHNNSLWMFPNVYPVWAVRGTGCKLVTAPRGTLAAWSLKRSYVAKKIFGLLFQNAVLRRTDMFHATSTKEYEEIRAQGYRQPIAIVPIGMDLPDVTRSRVERVDRVEG